MSKTKNTCIKKTLVRNVEQPISKTLTHIPPNAPTSSKVPTDSSSSGRHNEVSHSKSAAKTKFNVPEMNSTLKLSKKIDEIVQIQSTKSLPDVDKTEPCIDEKVSRKVNFPYGQPVFKDLIPLTDNEMKVQPTNVTRDILFKKDKEPNLCDFLQPRKPKVYYHIPKSVMKCPEKIKGNVSINGINLYKVLKINEDL